MAPEAFMQRPVRWLKAITHYRATVAFAPNFTFDVCVRRIPESELEGLDLSAWKVAGNGAEPIREHTLAEFVRKFAVCGFQEGSMWPGYGLAEATLLVTACQRGPGSTLWVDPDQLTQGRLVPTEIALGRPLVSCGWPLPGAQVMICDAATGDQLEEGVVGEIRISGPLVCDGYWRNPELTAETFTDSGLRTGDLGALWEGQLYVTGRLKDLLIVRGLNHYPQDIEHTMDAADPNLRRGCGVAVALPTDSGELLALIQEVRSGSEADPKDIVQKIRRHVIEEHGVAPDVIVLVPPRSIPQTTSGKVRRGAAAEALRTGGIPELYRWPGQLEE
jgi:acyl-CoA synthetase (AMP-forming)/AMP-acid ligase II